PETGRASGGKVDLFYPNIRLNSYYRSSREGISIPEKSPPKEAGFGEIPWLRTRSCRPGFPSGCERRTGLTLRECGCAAECAGSRSAQFAPWHCRNQLLWFRQPASAVQ